MEFILKEIVPDEGKRIAIYLWYGGREVWVWFDRVTKDSFIAEGHLGFSD